jgi:hypothetical protein
MFTRALQDQRFNLGASLKKLQFDTDGAIVAPAHSASHAGASPTPGRAADTAVNR